MSELLHREIEALSSGIFPDLEGRSSPLWVDGRNVYFSDRAAQGGLGQFLLFNPEERNAVLGIATAYIGTTPTLFYATKTSVWKWTEAGGLSEVTRGAGAYTGTNDDLWDFEIWGQWVLGTNGVDLPQLLKTTLFVDLTGLGTLTTLNSIVEHSPYMLAYNTNDDDKELAFCDTDDIEDWVPTDTNRAGTLAIRGLSSPVLAAKKLGPNIAAYSSDELRITSYIGEPLVYGVKPQIRGFGTVGKHAVVDKGDQHWIFGPRGIWITDGLRAKKITEGVVQDYIYNNINRDKWHLVVGFHDRVQQMIGFFYPSADAETNDRGIAFNYGQSNAVTLFNYGMTAAAPNSVFDFAIMGDANGNIFFASADGAPTATGNDAVMPIDETFVFENGFGQLGFGQGGYGGHTDG